jgi:BirA family transcriptional regulator, biotin operon repressor / biotin---[acetyl-CoA-carboxylase] ligase
MPSNRADGFDLARLRKDLKPFRLHWFPRLRSTNDHAAVMRRRGELYAPAVLLTGHQIAGRGRGSNTWWSGSGSLTATFVFPVEEHLSPHQIPLVAGLAVRRAVAGLMPGYDISLKWPNDLLYGENKLAGLLCERMQKADVIGLGLNVNVARRDVPTGLRQIVTSMREVSGREFDMTDVLVAVARELRAAMAYRGEQPFGQVLEQYNAHHALVGRRVTVTDVGDGNAVRGRVEGLDRNGRLVLRDRNKVHHVIAGQVQMI